MSRILGFCALLPLIFSAPAWAKNDDATLVHVQVSAARQLENDQLQATLFAEAQHSSRLELAKRLNAQVKQTLALAQKFPQITLQTQQHDVYPIYDKQKINAWRGRTALSLRSQDFDAVAKFIAQSSALMQMDNVHFAISPQKREKIEAELIQEATKHLQNRGKILAQALQKRRFRIVEMTLDHAQPQHFRAAPMMARAKNAEADLTPAFSAGEGEVRLHINATLALDD